jgi:hypothetical protein
MADTTVQQIFEFCPLDLLRDIKTSVNKFLPLPSHLKLLFTFYLSLGGFSELKDGT